MGIPPSSLPGLPQGMPGGPEGRSNWALVNPLDWLLGMLGQMPLWLKLVLFVHMRRDLENTLSKQTLDTFNLSNTMQLWQPKLSLAGQKELQQPSGKFAVGVTKLLQSINSGKDLASACLMNDWALEEAAIFACSALEKELIIPPDSALILGSVRFIASRIRIGEYLVQVGKITQEQLEQALSTQRYIDQAFGQRTGLGDILINLGYITREDAEGLLAIKVESAKHAPKFQLPAQAGHIAPPSPMGGTPRPHMPAMPVSPGNDMQGFQPYPSPGMPTSGMPTSPPVPMPPGLNPGAIIGQGNLGNNPFKAG